MKKELIFIQALLLITFLAIPVLAQDDAEESDDASELHVFRGGYIDMDFAFNFNTVGSSLGSGSMGGLISSRVKNGALNVNLNPAHLTSVRKGYVAIDSRLGLGTNFISSFNSTLLSSLNDELESAVDEEFSNEENWIQFPETYIQATEVRNLDVGLNDELASIAFAMPVSNKVTIAGAYSYPVSLNMDFGITGLSAKLAQEQGTEEVALRFDVLMNISLLTQMNFRMSTLSLGAGTVLVDQYKRKLSVGGTLTRYQLTNTRSLQADLSGMVVVGGADERFFNNPADPNLNTELGESNAFFMNAYGEFEATEYGIRLGVHYEVKNSLNLSVVYNQLPKFELVGTEKVSSAFLPVFLVGTGNDILKGDLEVALDSLEANKPNLTTERNISDFVKDGELNLPSSLIFGLDMNLGKHTMVLNYTRYLGDLSFEHGGNIIGKATRHGLGVGFDFRMNDRFSGFRQVAALPIRLLFLDIDGLLFQSLRRFSKYSNSHYRFGANVVVGEGIVTVNNSNLLETLGNPIPQSFSMGRQYTIFKNIDVGVTVLAFPDLLLKYSIGVRF